MAGEIQTQQTSLSGSTLYASLDRGGQRWNGTAFAAVSAGAWASYAVAMTEASGTGYFSANMPAGINTPGVVHATVYRRVGGSPAASDPVVGAGTIEWAGSERMLSRLHRRFYGKNTLTLTQAKTYADDGVTVLTTQAVADDGTTQTLGAAT